MSHQNKITDLFREGRHLHFLTVKGEKPRQQKIGFTADLCKKISNNYYVVRESNKKTPGYHFHALVDVIKTPPKAWYKKGVHINLQPVGRSASPVGMILPVGPPTQLEMLEEEHHTGDPVRELAVLDRCVGQARKRIRLNKHLSRIVTYMHKEQEFPAQYVDYVLVHRSKNVAL